jgi:hypothetical protein
MAADFKASSLALMNSGARRVSGHPGEGSTFYFTVPMAEQFVRTDRPAA